MSLSVLFLTLIYSSCSLAQFTVTQNAEVSASLGQSARFTCGRSGGVVTAGNYPAWYLQTPGNVPKRLVSSYLTDSQNYQPLDRFSAGLSGGLAVLSISTVQPEDQGVFYCLLYVGGDTIWIFGPGTPLNVITGEAKSPLMSIYPPSEEELKTGKSSTVCLGMDYTPGSATIQWTVDGATQTTGVSPLSISRQSNDRYSASSVLSMSSSDYEKYKQIACTMTHQGKSFVQILKTSECN